MEHDQLSIKLYALLLHAQLFLANVQFQVDSLPLNMCQD